MYKIINAATIDSMTIKVNNALSDGWKVQGSLAINSSNWVDKSFRYCQPMVR